MSVCLHREPPAFAVLLSYFGEKTFGNKNESIGGVIHSFLETTILLSAAVDTNIVIIAFKVIVTVIM